MSDDLTLAFDTEPILAWRAWGTGKFEFRDGSTEARLRPIARGGEWPGRRRMEATCAACHEAPWPDCMCGIWALKTREDAVAQADTFTPIYGRVALWGRVLEFETGYRAEFAYPQELWATAEVAADLRRVYGVDVHEIAQPPPTLEVDVISFPPSHYYFPQSGGRSLAVDFMSYFEFTSYLAPAGIWFPRAVYAPRPGDVLREAERFEDARRAAPGLASLLALAPDSFPWDDPLEVAARRAGVALR